MAKLCQMCDANLSFFRRGNLCKGCAPNFSAWSQLMSNIANLWTLSDHHLADMNKFGKIPLIKLYSKLYTELEYDKELDDDEIALLDRIQTSFALSKEDVRYDERVLPYLYVNQFRKTSQLPVVNVDSVLGAPVLLQKGELAHFAAPAVLRESRVVNLGYEGGSRGVSIRIIKGVYYRVGTHRGHIVKEEQLVQTSSGVLIITNERLFLVPLSGNKPVTIPLNKIHFYRCLENALEVYKEGREKGFFFVMEFGHVEIFGICLGELLQQE